ncbi:MAG: S9 family peptidase [Chloroflexi bacterium]|nr:S9 family peptidase [Chloroflexota bacterium]
MPILFENYLNIRQSYDPKFTADGSALLFLSNITGYPQLWRMEVNGGWPHQLTFGRDRVTGAWPSPADGRIIFARDSDGDENAQLFMINGDGSEERRLTNDGGTMHVFGSWSDDGTQIVFAANRRRPDRYDLYVQALSADEATLVWQNDEPGFLRPLALAPGGARVLVQLARSSMNHDLYEFSLLDKSVHLLTAHEGEVRYHHAVYSGDGRSLFCLSDSEREFSGVVRIRLSDLKNHWVATPDAEVEMLSASHDGRMLAWGVNADGKIELMVHDLLTGSTRLAPGVPTGVVSPVQADAPEFSPDDRLLAFAFSTPTRTADLWVWDVQNDQARQVTHSGHAGIPRASFVEPELVHYPTFDGRRVPAWYYRAQREGRKPVIVHVHGGPEGQTQPMLFPILQYFVQCGYSVLSPNVRGSTGYGKSYVHLDDVDKRMDAVADLAHAALWLKQQPDVDPGRIAVYGGSYGGFMVLAALTNFPDLWAAGVDIVGISNLLTFLQNTSSYRREHREAEYGSLERDRAFLERISPIRYVDRIRAPLFIVHGANDPRVPLSEAQQIADALRARNVPVEMLVYSDEGHGLVRLANKLDAYPRIARFLAAAFAEEPSKIPPPTLAR